MVLIFGWGRGPVDDRGEIAPIRCPNCHNDVFLHRIHSTKQVSLFFVPVMPYGSDDYLVCPVCGHGLQVRPEFSSAVDAMRFTTQTFRAGGISAADYQARTDAFWMSIGVAAPGAVAPAVATGTPTAAAPAAEASIADRIADLARLHANGVLTDAEFDAAKRKLLEL